MRSIWKNEIGYFDLNAQNIFIQGVYMITKMVFLIIQYISGRSGIVSCIYTD